VWKNVDKSVDMGIKDKSLTKNEYEGFLCAKSIFVANNLDLLKTDSLFSVRLLNF
jgi:hypothetical protein